MGLYRTHLKPLDSASLSYSGNSSIERNTPQHGKESFPSPSQNPIVVHIAGAVVQPGVYEIKPGQRAMEALALAGGILPDADLDKVNLAATLKDGQRLYIAPRKDSATPRTEKQSRSSSPSHFPVPVNTASLEQLNAIPGIGETTARNILEYRNRKGKITSATELTAIKGIGKKTLQKIEKYIMID